MRPRTPRAYTLQEQVGRVKLLVEGVELLVEGDAAAALVHFRLHEAGAISGSGTLPPGASQIRLDAILRQATGPRR